ncbi:MAG: hypothetical protein IT374_12465 [Polyangiaceae bacterium]|nr:hypothetical protein [Polyangiaceae bacterium]
MPASPLRPAAPLSDLDDPFSSAARRPSGVQRKASRFEPPPPELCGLFPIPPEQLEHVDSTGARFRMELDWNDRAKA